MDKTIEISLTGHDRRFRLGEDAYGRLARYLERAELRLADDPDRAEVLGDLERAVGDRLTTLLGTGDRLVTAAEVDGVLDAIGTVEAGRDPGPADEAPPRRRRMRRIREGQWFAGVCNGIAEYTEVGVDWVRTGFVLGTVFTGGLLILVYIALIFILPVESKRAA